MIKQYTVFGNPVEQSLSPQIHALFAEQVQRRLEYSKTLVDETKFRESVAQYQNSGGHGCNVTLPFKGEAFELCDSVSDEAELAAAVNTIKFQPDGRLVGHNTDGSGLVRDIKSNHQINIEGKRILISGAGGACRGILYPLLASKPSLVTITNRSMDKAEALVEKFSEFGPVDALSGEQLKQSSLQYDIIINATSLSLKGETPDLDKNLVANGALAYDLSYSRSSDTAFVSWARGTEAGKATDGLGMLLEQAADAFFIWEDVRPKTRLILPKIR